MQNQLREPINNHRYKARRALLLGTSGTGKSELATRLIQTHPASLSLVYDWQGGEYAGRLGVIPANDRDTLADQIDEGKRIICYNAEKSVGEKEARGSEFEWFCEMVYELGGNTPGRKLFTVDECHELIDPHNMPESLGTVLSQGRRRMIDTCLIGRAANAIQNEGRDQVTELYIFRTLDDNGLKYPKSLGLDCEQIKSLDDGEFLFRDCRKGRMAKLDLYK